MSSEYEQNIGELIAEKMEKLKSMHKDSKAPKEEIEKIEQDIEFLENLYDNYNMGMNYFRRARGGRAGLRE